MDPEIVALQHAAEAGGARFHVVTGPRALIALVTANDEVIALADGLLVMPEAAIPQFEDSPGVLVQPIEVGLPAGYERIDLNHAAAGAMRLPGRLVERLADLPPDFDAISALQRIALQAGVSQAMLPAALPQSGAWRLIRDEAEAHAAEAEWIRVQTSPPGAATITEMGIRLAVRSFGPALLHGGSGGNSVAIAAFVILLLAVAAGWFGFAATAFVLCGLAWALRRAAALLLNIEQQSLRVTATAASRAALFGWIVDAALVAVIAWNQTGAWAGPSLAARAFPAVMLIAMLRLTPRAIEAQWAHWLEDRAVLCLVLGIVAVGGLPVGVVAGLAVVLALLGVAWPDRPAGLTRA